MFSGIFYRYKFAMFRGKKLILATNNIHKQKEMDALLNDMNIKIVGLNQYSQVGEIEETGKTLIENSFIFKITFLIIYIIKSHKDLNIQNYLSIILLLIITYL